MARRNRLDVELVRRGLARSREQAAALVADGRVEVRGLVAGKPAALVDPADPVRVVDGGPDFVSRGGEKLRAGLRRFGVDPAGRDCLDVGASSGGFTDCLLQAGAARVAAVDVGYGQLAWSLRTDPRVAPLRGNLAGLPPAFVATCEFDPLRDEGIEYAEAMAAAGVPVEQLQARGHIHTSLMMVDVVITGVSGRVKMADALRGFAGLPRKLQESGEDAAPIKVDAAAG